MFICASSPPSSEHRKLGIHMSNPAQRKSRAETEGSTNPVELTPRNATTENVTSAIKLKDGRVLPAGGKNVPMPPPPGNFEQSRHRPATSMSEHRLATSLSEHRPAASLSDNSLHFLRVHLLRPSSITVGSNSLSVMIRKTKRKKKCSLPELHLE